MRHIRSPLSSGRALTLTRRERTPDDCSRSARRTAEWDPCAPAAVADPPASWRDLRETCPVAWSERSVLSPGGFWAVSRYDDVGSLAVAADRFNNSGAPQFGKRTSRRSRSTDPSTLSSGGSSTPTSPRHVWRDSRDRIRGFVAEMLEPVVQAGGGGDLAGQLTYPLPARTLCAWLGLPALRSGIPEAGRRQTVRRRGGTRERSGNGQAL